MCHVILDQNLGVGDVFPGADKHEGHHALLPRRGRLRLIVALHLDAYHAALVHDLLDDLPVLADDLPD